MNYIEQTLESVLKERMRITLEEYKKMVSKDEIEYDKALIEAGMIAVSKVVKNGR